MVKVVNHGIQESLMNKVIDGTQGFFNLREEEKKEFEGKHVLDPIRYGTSFNTSKEKTFFWRDYLKVFVHPKFHSPSKPDRYRYTRNLSSSVCRLYLRIIIIFFSYVVILCGSIVRKLDK